VSAYRFVSMGCEVFVGGATREVCAGIEEVFRARDRTFSRFVADSELNRVNACAGRTVPVSSSFASMLSLALDVARDTLGLVDPTLSLALEAAGYDKDFRSLYDDGSKPTGGPKGSWESVQLVDRHLCFPSSVRLDLNGIVKAKTIDDSLALLSADGFVCAGGDLAARGDIVVALPAGGTVQLVRGALATSGTDRRRWTRGGTTQHHLIDPRTGAPSRSRWRQVTACGATCLAADIAAKAAFLLDDDGPGWLDEHRIPGRFVEEDGTVLLNDAWPRSLQSELVCT
jgi:FAD:protein FMN transferase